MQHVDVPLVQRTDPTRVEFCVPNSLWYDSVLCGENGGKRTALLQCFNANDSK